MILSSSVIANIHCTPFKDGCSVKEAGQYPSIFYADCHLFHPEITMQSRGQLLRRTLHQIIGERKRVTPFSVHNALECIDI